MLFDVDLIRKRLVFTNEGWIVGLCIFCGCVRIGINQNLFRGRIGFGLIFVRDFLFVCFFEDRIFLLWLIRDLC